MAIQNWCGQSNRVAALRFREKIQPHEALLEDTLSRWRTVSIAAVAALAILVSPREGATQSKPASTDDSSVVGDWRGNSICVVRESACHDEDSLYHVTRLAEIPGRFSMKLDKIVDGKPVTMGTQECSYDSAKKSLVCEFPRGVMRFTIQGGRMEGTMSLTDGTLWRKITLKKSRLG